MVFSLVNSPPKKSSPLFVAYPSPPNDFKPSTSLFLPIPYDNYDKALYIVFSYPQFSGRSPR